MGSQTGVFVSAGSGVFASILLGEQDAKKRRLDLDTAAADATHWWDTSEVPLRPTPLKKWWLFWN